MKKRSMKVNGKICGQAEDFLQLRHRGLTRGQQQKMRLDGSPTAEP